jgi:hypothetical protein
MKQSEVFPSKYLSQADVPRPISAIVADVRREKPFDDDDEKAVLYFTDSHMKSMILNKGNWAALECAYGDESDNWRGKPVEVYVDPSVMYGGKRVGGLRLRVTRGGALPVSANGPAPQAWTLEQAVAELAKVGKTREELIDVLKAENKKGWLASRDTATAQRLIASVSRQEEENFDDGPAEDDSAVPF